MLYCNRTHAGEELAQTLLRRPFDQPIVLGMTRGGMVVAVPVARALAAELGFLSATKIRAPWNPDVAIGAITAAGLAYIDRVHAADPSMPKAYLELEKAKQLSLARQREKRLGASRMAVKGRTVLLVDDGLATGTTAVAAIRSTRASGASRVVVAVPVALPEALK